MWWPIKKTEKRIVRFFEKGLRLIQVTLFARLHLQYSTTMEKESAGVLAAQVVNYLKGEDIELVIESTPEPLKSQIAQIKDSLPERAANAMAESHSTREVIVATLRMREVLKFMLQGEVYLQSEEHRRISGLLLPYGPEFPEEIKPERYMQMAEMYYQEHYSSR